MLHATGITRRLDLESLDSIDCRRLHDLVAREVSTLGRCEMMVRPYQVPRWREEMRAATAGLGFAVTLHTYRWAGSGWHLGVVLDAREATGSGDSRRGRGPGVAGGGGADEVRVWHARDALFQLLLERRYGPATQFRL